MHGMSLVGLLMIIVTLGLFSAGAIVGLSTMTGPSNNESAGSQCHRRKQPARLQGERRCRELCEHVLLHNNGGTSYPRTWSDLTTSTPPAFELPSGVVINGAYPQELDGPGWKLIMSGGGPNPTTFACS